MIHSVRFHMNMERRRVHAVLMTELPFMPDQFNHRKKGIMKFTEKTEHK